MILDKNDKSFLKKLMLSDSSYTMINEKGAGQFKCLSCSCVFYVSEDFGLMPCHNELVINKFPPSDEEKRALKINDVETLRNIAARDPMLEIFALCKKCDNDQFRKHTSIEKLREKRAMRYVFSNNKGFVKSYEKAYKKQPGELLLINFAMGKYARNQDEISWGSGGVVIANLRKSEIIYFVGSAGPALSQIKYYQLYSPSVKFE